MRDRSNRDSGATDEASVVVPQPGSSAWGVVVTAFVVSLLLTLAASAIQNVNHDEQQFIAPAKVLLQDGLLPYRDYAYFHLPYLPFTFAALFTLTDHLLAAARALTSIAGAATVAVVAGVAHSTSNGQPPRTRFALALAFGLMLTFSPSFIYTSGVAWNHHPATLFAVLALVAHVRAHERSSLRTAFLSGLALGLSVGFRLTAAPLAAAFLISHFVHPIRSRVKSMAAWAGGAFVALVPVLVLALSAPRQFLFGNFGYPALNTAYYREVGDPTLSLIGKIAFYGWYLVTEPAGLIILGVTAFACWTWWRSPLGRRSADSIGPMTTLALLPFVLVGSLAPTPSMTQYFYALVPMFLLLSAYCLPRVLDLRRYSARLLVISAAVVVLLGLPRYLVVKRLSTPGRWSAVRVHESGRHIAEQVSSGRVLTLSPLFALEGGASVYSEWITGPFAWRTARFLPGPRRERLAMSGPSELESLLARRPPAAILVGLEGAEEKPFVDYAREHGFAVTPIGHGLELWIP